MSAIEKIGGTAVRSVFLGAFLCASLSQNALAKDPGVVTTESGMRTDHYHLDADYMWNCGGAESCSPTQGPDGAVFRQTFTVKKNLPYPQYFYGTGAANPNDPFNDFALSLIADDYFSVYLNNHLLGWSWLNDGSSPNKPHFSDAPMNFTIGDLLPYFVDGNNVLDIFACNGRTSDNLNQGYAPGSTTNGGFSGCPNPSSYGYKWLLVQGGFVEQDNAPGGKINASATFVSGNATGENAHETGFMVVPEPDSILLIGTGLFLALRISRKPKNTANGAA